VAGEQCDGWEWKIKDGMDELDARKLAWIALGLLAKNFIPGRSHLC
jgi:hypothetical protein